MEFFGVPLVLLTEIAKQSFGYTLAVIFMVAFFFVYRNNQKCSKDLVEAERRRVNDLKEAQKLYNTQIDKLTDVANAGNRIAENTYQVLQNVQSIVNSLNMRKDI